MLAATSHAEHTGRRRRCLVEDQRIKRVIDRRKEEIQDRPQDVAVRIITQLCGSKGKEETSQECENKSKNCNNAPSGCHSRCCGRCRSRCRGCCRSRVLNRRRRGRRGCACRRSVGCSSAHLQFPQDI